MNIIERIAAFAHRTTDRTRTAETAPGRDPWWVRVFMTVGPPAVAAVVLVISAPAEHRLAQLVGWDWNLAWGMAFLLATYAGVSSGIAAKRRKGDPGAWTARVGALLSLILATAVQTVAHLIATGHVDVTPVPVWLVVGMSCIPGLVLVHLMHVTVKASRYVPPVVDNDDQDDQDHGVRLTLKEVVELIATPASTVRNWVQDGKLTPVGKNSRGHNLFDPEEARQVAALVAAAKPAPQGPAPVPAPQAPTAQLTFATAP